MLVAISVGLLIFSFALLACERWAPRTPYGRIARMVLTYSPLSGARYRITGKHIVFFGIGWKAILALCALLLFLLNECQL